MTAPHVLSIFTDIAQSLGSDIGVLAGDNLYVQGLHLNTATDVKITGVSVPFVWNGFQLVVVIPTGMKSGPVTVTNPDGSDDSSASVILCVPGPWITHAPVWWPVNQSKRAEMDSNDPDLTAALNGSGVTATIRPPGSFPVAAGLQWSADDGSGVSRWYVQEVVFPIALAGALGGALDGSLLPTPPTGAVTVRYENGDGHLTASGGGEFRVTLQVQAQKAGTVYRVGRLAAGEYDTGTLASTWIAPADYPTSVHNITTTSGMVAAATDVIFADSGLDAGTKAGFALLYEAIDGSEIDMSGVGDFDFLNVKPTRAELYMTAPRFRWLSPKPDVLPSLRYYPRDDAVAGSPRTDRSSTSRQSSARQGWTNTYR